MILTEDKNSKAVKEIVAERFEGFTLFRGVGHWVGKCIPHRIYDENNLTIMILTNDGEGVKDIAREIKRVNNQESVLVVGWDAESEFV
jgi:hypothetical protein